MKALLCTVGIASAVLLGITSCAGASGNASVAGTWGDPDAAEIPSLTFEGSDTSGEYSGTDGCNTVGGAYAVDGDTVDLGMMRTTLMYCEGVDTWLSQARTATLDGDTLVLLNEGGQEIGTLDRNAS